MVNGKCGIILAAACLMLSSLPGFAAKVAEVRFEQEGTRRLPVEQLKFNVQLREGVEFKQTILDEDVKRLFNTGNYADVVSEVEKLPEDRVAVTFKIRLKPRITLIVFEGNVKFTAADLRKQITLAEGGLLNDIELRASANKLREFYHEKGYRQVVVVPVDTPDGDEAVRLTFRIVENLKQRVNDVTFEGSTLFSQFDLRHSINNQYSYLNWIPFVNDYLNFGLLDKPELELDKARLRDKYQEEGYLDFKVEEVSFVGVPDEPEYVNIHFKVFEGEPYKIGKVALTGNSVFSDAELAPAIQVREGDTFSLSREMGTARAIVNRYETLGYADVTCRPIRRENFETHTVDIDYEVVEGRKFTVRDVIPVGNTDTKSKVILRELAIQPGDPVDRNRIEVSKQRLMGMGYFEKVDITTAAADSPDEKDVRIEVQEKDGRYNFRIGGGISDVNSAFGMVELSSNNFDITNPGNLFYGGGQKLRAQGILGIDNAGFNVDFIEPWLFDIPLRFELSGYMNEVQYSEWNERRIGGRTSFSHRLFDDFTKVTLGYKLEYVKIYDVAARLDSYVKGHDYDEGVLVSQPSLTLVRDTRDSFVDPTSGYMAHLFGSVTPQFLGASKSYYRLEAKGSYHINFFDKAIVGSLAGKIGTVAGFDRDSDDVPLFEKYFLGGGDSIRGFDYRSVSPKYNEKSIGGQTMLLVTAEVSHPIWGPVRGAVFCDVGNASRNSYSMPFSDLNVGLGYGLRIKLPYLHAPIKLDLAYPIVNNVRDESSKLRFHFNIGFTF